MTKAEDAFDKVIKLTDSGTLLWQHDILCGDVNGVIGHPSFSTVYNNDYRLRLDLANTKKFYVNEIFFSDDPERTKKLFTAIMNQQNGMKPFIDNILKNVS